MKLTPELEDELADINIVTMTNLDPSEIKSIVKHCRSENELKQFLLDMIDSAEEKACEEISLYIQEHCEYPTSDDDEDFEEYEDEEEDKIELSLKQILNGENTFGRINLLKKMAEDAEGENNTTTEKSGQTY